MPAEGGSQLRHHHLPRLEELSAIVAWLAAEVGVGSIKLTGGEPLVRQGVETLVTLLASIPGIDEISMTTNGTLLARHANALQRAGLRRVNISLDTLDPSRFARLTRGGRLRDTLAGIDAALDSGLRPVKLNAVLLASSWRLDVPRLLDFAAEHALEVRFIELMRTGTEEKWAASELAPAAMVRSWIERRAQLFDLAAPLTTPSRSTRLRWAGRDLTVGWITPRSHPFCATCNRLRLDPLGRLRRCLMDPTSLQLAALLTDGRAAARTALASYLGDKRPPGAMSIRLPMAAVGG
jgi:GTP 3',8-cyclase